MLYSGLQIDPEGMAFNLHIFVLIRLDHILIHIRLKITLYWFLCTM